jgi:signal transduction histidine kinase
MSGIGSTLRRFWIEIAWAAFALANIGVIVALRRWETIPFHFVWVSLTLVYGYRVWRIRSTAILLAAVMLLTGAALVWTINRGHETLDELAEVPLMAAMFIAMVWHAQRRQAAMEEVRRSAESEHEMLERQRDFVRDASHELRTPITIASGHAELIRATAAEPQVVNDAAIVLDELDRLSGLSERLLLLAAASHPRFLTFRRVDVRGLIIDLERRWTPAAERRWRFACDIDGSLRADEERLKLAIDALIENAIKFTGPQDEISVTLRRVGGAAEIEVADSGEGIPPEDLPRVFDRFARAHHDRARRSGGTGLGLAIVKAIAEAHGGSVSVRVNDEGGSTFRLTLPGLDSSPRPKDSGAMELAPQDQLRAMDDPAFVPSPLELDPGPG